MNYIRSNKKGQSGGGGMDFISAAKKLVSPNWTKNGVLPADETLPRLFSGDLLFLTEAVTSAQFEFRNVPRNHDHILITGWVSLGHLTCIIFTSSTGITPASLSTNLPFPTDGSFSYGIYYPNNPHAASYVNLVPFTGQANIWTGVPNGECPWLSTYDIYTSDNQEVIRKNCDFSDFMVQFAA